MDLSTATTPVYMFCPNCGNKLIGYKDENGGVKMQCKKCGIVAYSKYHPNKKETDIKVKNK